MNHQQITADQKTAAAILGIAAEAGQPPTTEAALEVRGMLEEMLAGAHGRLRSATIIVACDEGVVIAITGNSAAITASSLVLEEWMKGMDIDVERTKQELALLALNRLIGASLANPAGS